MHLINRYPVDKYSNSPIVQRLIVQVYILPLRWIIKYIIGRPNARIYSVAYTVLLWGVYREYLYTTWRVTFLYTVNISVNFFPWFSECLVLASKNVVAMLLYETF